MPRKYLSPLVVHVSLDINQKYFHVIFQLVMTLTPRGGIAADPARVSGGRAGAVAAPHLARFSLDDA